MKTGASQTVINKQVSCIPLPAVVSTLCQTVIQFPVLSPPHEFDALAPPVFRQVSEWVDIPSTGKTNKQTNKQTPGDSGLSDGLTGGLLR